jgi:outer membrane protein assembly factor BamB
VILADGRFLLVSIGEGRILWTGESHLRSGEVPANSPGEISLLYDERGIYVFSKTGATAFAEDGRRLWTMRFRGAAAIPALSDDGLLFSGGSDWILYAYKVEDRVREGQQSFYGPAPEGNYGLGSPPADYYFRSEETFLAQELVTIAAAIQEGRVGEDEPAYAAYLMKTVGMPANNSGFDFHPVVNIQRRVEALRLLGFIGSRETIPFLANVFSRDREPLIKAAAADAIGRIGVDPERTALRAFTEVLLYPFSQDERVLMAMATAVGALCRFSGPPLSNAGIGILGILAGEGMPTAVRIQVRRELASLWG